MAPRLLVFVAFTLLPVSLHAQIVTFGSGANQFNMAFVPIGDPGNVPDTTGSPNPAGAVSYTYGMSKFEVSRDMIIKANALSGMNIFLFDMSPYGGNGVDRPATGISWNAAARFVNWLNVSKGYSPAYKFALQPGEPLYNAKNNDIELWNAGDAGYDPANPFRNSLANYVLPSFDEWYKAAYYDPVSDTYFDFPNGSDTAPTAVASGTADNTAVYGQTDAQGPADISQAGGLSPFGIMGMGGNVFEWEESEIDLMNDNPIASRGLRGGLWNFGSAYLSSSSRFPNAPQNEGSGVGFRVVSLSTVPEPGTMVLCMTGIVLLGLFRRRFPRLSRRAADGEPRIPIGS